MAANSYDQYIGDEVVLPYQKGGKLMVKFKKRVKCYDSVTGEGNYNPMYDKSLYEVEYPDGTMEQLVDNIIPENMMSQVDSEGLPYQLFT